jgi:Protein of unknown function (DUF2384)
LANPSSFSRTAAAGFGGSGPYQVLGGMRPDRLFPCAWLQTLRLLYDNAAEGAVECARLLRPRGQRLIAATAHDYTRRFRGCRRHPSVLPGSRWSSFEEAAGLMAGRLVKSSFLLQFKCYIVSAERKASMARPHAPSTNVDKGALVGKSVLRAAARLDVSNRALAKIIGLSEPSVSRLAQGTFTLDPSSKPFELALLFVRLFRSLDAITGADEAVARAWLRAANAALGARPLDLISHVSGLTDVIAYLDSRRAIV